MSARSFANALRVTPMKSRPTVTLMILVNAVCGSARKLIESTLPVSVGSTRISEKYFEPCDSAEVAYRTPSSYSVT